MNCDKCHQPLAVYDEKDPKKPLRCSDACPENRKSLEQRGVKPEKDKEKDKEETHRPTTRGTHERSR
jgi:hypothetical protein